MSYLGKSSVLLGDATVPGVPLSKELQEYAPKILQACRDWGLDFYPTVIQLLTYDEISEIAAYGGFPVRFPHWSFGMEYEELQQGYMHGFHRIYEMVINSNPCYQWLLSSNTLVDNLTVVAHATGHNDFFKNNIHFSATDTNMLNKMANHGTRIRNYMTRWGKERVTEFIDWVMRLETLIDGAEAWTEKTYKNPILHDQRTYRQPRRINIDKERQYMEPFVNTKEFRQKENEKIVDLDVAEEIGLFKNPTRNIMGFLRDNAPLKPWQSDIISMLYDEAMYFFPQRQTKILNEGHACTVYKSLVLTNKGYMQIGHIVENRLNLKVYDGSSFQKIKNWFCFEDLKTVKLRTKRGYEIEGALSHRILNQDFEWKRLEDWKINDQLLLSRCEDVWTTQLKEITWKPAQFTKNLTQISNDHSVDRKDIWAMRRGRKFKTLELEKDVLRYENECQNLDSNVQRRKGIVIPAYVNEDFAQFLGYMIGDGHISETGRTLGLTTGDLEQAESYENLLKSLFCLNSRRRWDDSSKSGRWRISVSSNNLEDLLKSLGLKTGVCARQKLIPDCILQSPKSITSSFLRAYFDCDGYAGECGVILSTSSEELGKQVQIVLLNFGIISSRKQAKSKDPKKTHIWHVSIRGRSAIKFKDEIGFGLGRKQQKLNKYINDHSFFYNEKWTDEVEHIEYGEETVYDFTVENTHRYVAQGFINHNSMTDSVIMAEQGFVSLGQKSDDCGIVEYSQHKMGVLGGKYSTNPYKLGYNLLSDIRNRWDKGQFGEEWDNCKDLKKKENWNIPTNLGKEKIFEVRKYYDDFTFLHEFFTEDFCREQEYLQYRHYPNGETRIEDRNYKDIKHMLMQRHLNGGLPNILLMEPNYRGKGAMLLQHEHDGRQIYHPYVAEVLTAIRAIWGQDVYLATKDANEKEQIYCCYGTDAERNVEVVSRQQHSKGRQ